MLLWLQSIFPMQHQGDIVTGGSSSEPPSRALKNQRKFMDKPFDPELRDSGPVAASQS
jgi:hypothetical protein